MLRSVHNSSLHGPSNQTCWRELSAGRTSRSLFQQSMGHRVREFMDSRQCQSCLQTTWFLDRRYNTSSVLSAYHISIRILFTFLTLCTSSQGQFQLLLAHILVMVAEIFIWKGYSAVEVRPISQTACPFLLTPVIIAVTTTTLDYSVRVSKITDHMKKNYKQSWLWIYQGCVDKNLREGDGDKSTHNSICTVIHRLVVSF